MREFGKRELELMQILWQHGEQTAQQIREKVGDPLADPTVRTMLRILEEKGAVAHKKRGRAFIYRAKVPAKRTIKHMLGRIIEGFFGGSAEALVAHMVDERDLTPQALEKIRREAKKRH
jgi:BlaI family penicillinase repressor